jgi:hypothetical protein
LKKQNAGCLPTVKNDAHFTNSDAFILDRRAAASAGGKGDQRFADGYGKLRAEHE